MECSRIRLKSSMAGLDVRGGLALNGVLSGRRSASSSSLHGGTSSLMRRGEMARSTSSTASPMVVPKVGRFCGSLWMVAWVVDSCLLRLSRYCSFTSSRCCCEAAARSSISFKSGLLGSCIAACWLVFRPGVKLLSAPRDYYTQGVAHSSSFGCGSLYSSGAVLQISTGLSRFQPLSLPIGRLLVLRAFSSVVASHVVPAAYQGSVALRSPIFLRGVVSTLWFDHASRGAYLPRDLIEPWLCTAHSR